MRFRMLGPLRVWDGESWTPIRADQQRVVLAVLLSETGRSVRTDRLIDEIWGERPPRSALVTVQGYVRRLRILLGDHGHDLLRTRGHGYELSIDADEVDAGVFDQLADIGARELADGDPEKAAAFLSKALDLWSGPALDDVPAGTLVAAEAARLDRRRLAVVEDRLDALLALGRHAAVVDELRRTVDANPLRERLRTQLMLALHRCGRRAEALQTYREARQAMLAEFGVEPGTELRRLEHMILTDGARPHRVEPVTSAVPTQLPADIAGFTGRDDHLARLDTLLRTGRAEPAAVAITVLAGAAGVGKTALAVRFAHRVRQHFPDGQLYVNLRGYGTGAPLRPADALAQFLTALGVPAGQVPAEEHAAAGLYRTLLADRRVLVLLDNADHPDQVRPLLPGSPGCLVLVTSRDRLDGMVARDGAARLALDVLTPVESVGLLERLLGTERVRAETTSAAVLAAMCGHLPLALRIAAANLSAQPDRAIADYAARLAAGDRLMALAVKGDPPATMWAAFDDSYAALPTAARRLFRLLGLAPGVDVSAAAAAALAGVPPAEAARLLDRLTAVHLLDEHAHGRYSLHHLVRLYAAARTATEDGEPERAAALDRLHDHHLTHANAAEHGRRPVSRRLADALAGYLRVRTHTVDWSVIASAALVAASLVAEQARCHPADRRALTHHRPAGALLDRIGADPVAAR